MKTSSPSGEPAAGPSAPGAADPAIPSRRDARDGLLAALGAYLLWGVLPLYLLLVPHTGPLALLTYRVLFALVVCLVLVTALRQLRDLLRALSSPRTLGTFALAAAIITVNWFTYLYAATTGNLVEAALGYFINPLVSALLGVFVLRERLRPAQWAALGLGFVAVVVATLSYGRVPWLALILAFSFGFYGLAKNRVGRTVSGVVSLAAETAILAPLALVAAVVLWLGGEGSLSQHGAGYALAIVGLGVITAVPLLLFAASARRLPLSVLGFTQYLAPLIQFAIAVTILREPMSAGQWWGFGIVWLSVLLFSADAAAAARQRRGAAPAV